MIRHDQLTIKNGQRTGIVYLVKRKRKRVRKMPIEYEMKYLYETTVDAISRYSEDHTAAYWFINIAYTVLKNLNNKDFYTLVYFKENEISAMRELIRRGYWVKWSESEGKPMLSKDPLLSQNQWDDTKPVPNGAD